MFHNRCCCSNKKYRVIVAHSRMMTIWFAFTETRLKHKVECKKDFVHSSFFSAFTICNRPRHFGIKFQQNFRSFQACSAWKPWRFKDVAAPGRPQAKPNVLPLNAHTCESLCVLWNNVNSFIQFKFISSAFIKLKSSWISWTGICCVCSSVERFSNQKGLGEWSHNCTLLFQHFFIIFPSQLREHVFNFSLSLGFLKLRSL